MQTAKLRVKQWGNSVGLLVPKHVAATVGLQIDTQVLARYQASEFFIIPIPHYDLSTLLRGMTAADLPQADWDTTGEDLLFDDAG